MGTRGLAKALISVSGVLVIANAIYAVTTPNPLGPILSIVSLTLAVTALAATLRGVRMGQAASMAKAEVRRRIEAAIGGRGQLADLTAEERLLANAEIDAAIEQTAVSTDFAARLAAEGIATVVMDDDGRLVTRHPDGRARG